MKLIQSEKTLTTLANANELVANIVRGVLGNEVADTIAGDPVTREQIYDVTQVRAQMSIAPLLKAN